MRYVTIFIILFLIEGCNQNGEEKLNTQADTVSQKADTISKKLSESDSVVLQHNADTALLNFSNEILQILKNKNYQKLATFINSEWSIRFSPYGHIDTLRDQKFTAAQLLKAAKTQKKMHWGNYDGTGDTINLSLTQYFEKFVYDIDFLNAKQKSVDKIISGGTTFDNLQSLYPNCNFTQFYFPGSGAKYNFMDWKALVLVFKKEAGKSYLVAVVHDQWRI